MARFRLRQDDPQGVWPAGHAGSPVRAYRRGHRGRQPPRVRPPLTFAVPHVIVDDRSRDPTPTRQARKRPNDPRRLELSFRPKDRHDRPRSPGRTSPPGSRTMAFSIFRRTPCPPPLEPSSPAKERTSPSSYPPTRSARRSPRRSARCSPSCNGNFKAPQARQATSVLDANPRLRSPGHALPASTLPGLRHRRTATGRSNQWVQHQPRMPRPNAARTLRSRPRLPAELAASFPPTGITYPHEAALRQHVEPPCPSSVHGWH